MIPMVFEAKMKAIVDDKNMDFEQAHIAMDNLMCELLENLGYEAGIKVFKEATKYYS